MYDTLPNWTAQDEQQLQRAIESRDFWAASLEASITATSLREGERARTERRDLIFRADQTIARLMARKREAA